MAGIFGFRYFIRPSVDYRNLRTAPIVMGSIQASLTANGRVVPQFEQLITSPLQARIDSVYHGAGAVVKAGTPILKLDLIYTQLELEKLEEGLQKKRNETTLIRLRMEKSLAELQAQSDIKQLQIHSLENEKHLHTMAAVPPKAYGRLSLSSGLPAANGSSCRNRSITSKRLIKPT